MNFDTTLGKSLKVLFWVVVSGVIAALLEFFTNNPDFFTPPVVGIINIILVAGKNLLDSEVENV